MPKATCIMLNQQFLEIYLLCFQKKLYYAHIMLNYVMGFNLWPKAKLGIANLLWLNAAVMLQYKQK